MDRLITILVIYSWLFMYVPYVSLATINIASDSYKGDVALLVAEKSAGVLLGADKTVVGPTDSIQLPIKVKLHSSDSKMRSKRNMIKDCFTAERGVARRVGSETSMGPNPTREGAARQLPTYVLPEPQPPRRRYRTSNNASQAEQAAGSSSLREENPESNDHSQSFEFPRLATSNSADAEALLENFHRSYPQSPPRIKHFHQPRAVTN